MKNSSIFSIIFGFVAVVICSNRALAGWGPTREYCARTNDPKYCDPCHGLTGAIFRQVNRDGYTIGQNAVKFMADGSFYYRLPHRESRGHYQCNEQGDITTDVAGFGRIVYDRWHLSMILNGDVYHKKND